MSKEYVEKRIVVTDEDGSNIEMIIKGDSVVPFFNTDLYFKAAITILEHMDYKDFYENNQHELYEKYVNSLKENSERIINYD